MGGSPCTHWSIAQTKNRETEPSGLGWELFENYVIGLKKYKPDYFLYENNKSMSPAIREQITKELGVEPILINSALVSAQNRNRLYWTNIPGVTQPEDKGILLKDILDTGMAWKEKSYTLDANYYKTAGTYNPKSQHSYSRHMAAELLPFGINELGKVYALNDDGFGKARTIKAQYYKNSTANAFYSGTYGATLAAVPINTTVEGKSQCLRATYYKDGIRNMVGNNIDKKTCVGVPMCIAERGRYKDGKVQQNYEPQYSRKTNTLTTVQKDNLVIDFWDGKTYPVYEIKSGQISIKGKQYPIKLPDGYYIIRKLTVAECMRLQTVPDIYIFPVSNTQAYKMLGNGWTVDVIAHILSFVPGITEEEIRVMSMYDGMSCGHIALDKLGANVVKYYATEIDKYAIQTARENYPEIIHLGDAYQVRNEDWFIN